MSRRFRLSPFDAHGQFHPPEDGLRRLAIRGAAATVSARGVALAVQVISTVVLVRLLTPADFGLVAMVSSFSLLLTSFGQNGLTEAIIQRDELDDSTASNLFWINASGGLLLAIGFAGAGSLLALFYRNPLVARVAVSIAPTIFLTNACYVHLALLKRAMRFPVVSANSVSSRGIAVAVSILLAWLGWGYWALVVGAIAQSVSMTIGAWTLCRWVPSLPRRAAGTGSALRFALPVFARFSMRYFLRNMDNVLVGWQFSAGALGFYKKAYDLFAFSADQLIAPVADVALATLSRLRKDPAQFRRYLINSLAIIAFVGMGVGADLTLVGRDAIRLVLGPKWAESGRIFSLFGPGIGIMLLHSTCGWIHLSIGTPGRWLRWTLVELAVTAGLFFLALHWGPAGIAAAWSASFWILTLPAFWYAGQPIQFGASSVVAATWKYVVASLVAGCACAGIVGTFASLAAPSSAVAALEGIILISGMFLVLYLGVVVLLHRGCAPIYRLAGLLKEMIPRRGSRSPVEAVAATGG